MKNLIVALCCTIPLIGMAQKQLNDYRYIIVPKQFSEFKRVNQYHTSTLAKYLFNEKGFETVYDDELPPELKSNGCLGLRAKLVDGSSMFTTKAAMLLTNCNGEEIFRTKEGRSKEKEYKASYSEALREAFTSFDGMAYAYNGKAENSGPLTISMKNDIKEIPQDQERAKAAVDQPNAMVDQQASRENQKYIDRRPVPSNLKKAEPENEMVEQEATREQQKYKDLTPTKSSIKKEARIESTTSSVEQDSGVSMTTNGSAPELATLVTTALYAQELSNGYQLVDSTSQIRMKIVKTSMPDFFMAQAGNTSGTVFKKNGVWYFEHYSGDDLMTEELDIKF